MTFYYFMKKRKLKKRFYLYRNGKLFVDYSQTLYITLDKIRLL